MLRVRLCYDPGMTLGISVQRPKDGWLFDFKSGVFVKSAPAQQILPMAEESGVFAGRYSAQYGPTPPDQWWERRPFVVTLHELGPKTVAVIEFAVEFEDGNNTFSYPPFITF